MINSELPEPTESTADQRVNGSWPAGRLARSRSPGIATAIVVAIYFAFYFFVFLPRGAVAMTRAGRPSRCRGRGADREALGDHRRWPSSSFWR